MKKALCIILAGILLSTGCNLVKTEESKSTTPVTNRAETTVSSETTTETTTEATTTESTTEATTTAAPEPFEFNPHIHSDMLSKECVKDEWWDSFYNMCDAIRAGEDSFLCCDKDAYDFCTDIVMIGALMPAACTLVEGAGYENGVAKLTYKMDKDKFLAREKAFEEEVVRMLNEAIRSDYSEIEKITGLYTYIGKHFTYDFSSIENSTIDDFGDYACLMTKTGICTEIAGAYAYLLLQVGVDALEIGENDEHQSHAWTYVICNGKGYHADATWALGNGDPSQKPIMNYFMMTDDDRAKDDFIMSEVELSLVSWRKPDYDRTAYKATDPQFSALHDYGFFVEMDTENNIIRYEHNGEMCELSYED